MEEERSNSDVQMVEERYRNSKVRKMVVMAAVAAVAATVYLIWGNKNYAYRDQVIITVDKTVHEIKYIVKHRIIQIVSAKMKVENSKWIDDW